MEPPNFVGEGTGLDQTGSRVRYIVFRAAATSLLLFMGVALFALASCQADQGEAGTRVRAADPAPGRDGIGPPRQAGGSLSSRSGGDRPDPEARLGLPPTEVSPEEQDGGAAGEPSGGADGRSNDDDSSSPYAVEVSIAEQRVRVYRHGELIREMVASTGTPDKPTPAGHFRLQNRGEWFYSRKYQQGAKWWVSFKDWGVYLFHSVPMDAQKQIIPEEAAKLGQPASHGCVRLSVEDARWFYETLPQGTPVHIY